MTETSGSAVRRRWAIVGQSVGAALFSYLFAGTLEIGLIRALRPSERELAWVSDVVLSCSFGVAVYLWRHLVASRQELADRERAELVLNTQLAVASDLQQRLLPPLPPTHHGVEWAACLQPAGRIGGDFYDVVTLAPGRWVLLVADISGKGIPAAMALSTLRASFRALAKDPNGPSALLTQLSATLYEQWAGVPYFTGIVVELDRDAGTVTYSNAAHPAGVLAGPDGVRVLDAGGPPAALLPGQAYEERTLPLRPGDVCVLVSDGVTEALGDQRSSAVEQIAGAAVGARTPASAICDEVMAAALHGTGPEDVTDWQDDRTVVVLMVREDAVPLRRAANPPGRSFVEEGRRACGTQD